MTATERRRKIREDWLAGYADRQADREARRIERNRARSKRSEGYRFWVKRKPEGRRAG